MQVVIITIELELQSKILMKNMLTVYLFCILNALKDGANNAEVKKL